MRVPSIVISGPAVEERTSRSPAAVFFWAAVGGAGIWALAIWKVLEIVGLA